MILKNFKNINIILHMTYKMENTDNNENNLCFFYR